tara:strand:- start:274 stop:516 length:243 start_codon:yes stop_codon:yes gene_type:complete
MKRVIIVLAAAALLAGCTAAQQAVVTGIASKASDAADIKLKNSKWTYCNLQTSGAWFRNPDRVHMQAHCFPDRKDEDAAR